MRLDSTMLGQRSAPYTVEVTSRQAMNFAAGIPDPNPAYLDDTRPEGILAPPLYPVALSWQMTVDYDRYWSDSLDAEIRTRIVHYSEVLQLHRPIEAGDRLTVTGKVVAIQPHRAGTHFVIRYGGVAADGTPVFTEYAGAMLRGVTCADDGATADGVPAVGKVDDSDAPIAELDEVVDALAAHRYDAGADIHNPIHTSPAFAQAVGLPAPILQGTCTLSRVLREIVNAHAGGDPRRVRDIRCNFTGMVLMDSTIRLRLLRKDTGDDGIRVYFNVLNAAGEQAIRNGSVTLAAGA